MGMSMVGTCKLNRQRCSEGCHQIQENACAARVDIGVEAIRDRQDASHCRNEEVDVVEMVGVRVGEPSLSSGLTGSLRSAD